MKWEESINMLEGVNLYDEYNKVESKVLDAKEKSYIGTLNNIFKKRNVPEDMWSRLGNVVIRFSHYMCEQTEPINLPPYPENEDDSKDAKTLRLMHLAADIYEDLNKEYSEDVDLSYLDDVDLYNVLGVEQEIDTVGKSTLLNFRYRLVGFTYINHPIDDKLKIQLTFFHQLSDSGRYCFCLSEIHIKQVKGFRKKLREKIGTIVSAEEVVPYVHRSVQLHDDDSLKAFRAIIHESVELNFDVKVEW